MRKTTKLALLLSAALLATSAVAQDHLVPPGGIAEYQDVVSKLFKEAFTDDVHVRATVEPPHPSEFAVGTKVMNGRYRIFYLQANDYIWFALYNEKGNGPLLNKTLDHEIGIDSCEYDISNETGERLDLIWDTMLRGTRPDESKYIILDGTAYLFGKTVDGKPMLAEANSPSKSSKSGALVAVVSTMRNLCATKDKSLLDKLSRESTELLDRLKSEPPP